MRLKALIFAGAASVLVVTAASAQPPAPGAPLQATPRPHGQFARMDRDADGRVTREEFVAFQDRMFDRIDVNHTGQITKADLDAFMARREAEQAGRMMRAKGGGANGGGGEQKKLTKLSDRIAANGALTKQQWEAMAERRFDRLDVAHLGYLTPDALHRPSDGMNPASDKPD